MPDLNDAQFPRAGSVRFRRNRVDPEGPRYLSEDQRLIIDKNRRDRWSVTPQGADPVIFPTMRDAVDYANHPAEWEPEHKAAWLQGLEDV
jgi:hypothetical protein